MAARPNQKWVVDISYIWTQEGWLYLAVVLDLYSRRVIGWAVSNRMKRDLAIRALDMAVALRKPTHEIILVLIWIYFSKENWYQMFVSQ